MNNHSSSKKIVINSCILLILLSLLACCYFFINFSKTEELHKKDVLEVNEKAPIEDIKVAEPSVERAKTSPKKVVEKKKTPKKVTLKKQSLKKRIPKKKVPKIDESMFIKSYQLTNNNGDEKVSLFVFNSENQYDMVLFDRFKNEFEQKGYVAEAPFIKSKKLSSEIVKNLSTRNLTYFKGNLNKYAHYICVAKSNYSFAKNSLRKDLTDCYLKINYDVFSTETGELVLSEKDEVIGIGDTKKEATKNAISKFVL